MTTSVNNMKTITINDLKIDDSLKKYFTYSIEENVYTNLLFYGNPGTGKTTTAVVMINTFIEKNFNKYNITREELRKTILSMNASVYRNTGEFLNTIKMFSNTACSLINTKFVLLDEIDYMTLSGQKSLISLIKSYDNIIFICMCNYLSKLCDELKEYFTIVNYNCFGNILKEHIKNENNYQSSMLFELLLNDSDIRFYNNEKYRIHLLSKQDVSFIDAFLKKNTAEIKEHILNQESINVITHCIDDTALTKIQTISGINKLKIKFIIYQEAVDGLLDNNQVDTEYLVQLLEHILFKDLIV